MPFIFIFVDGVGLGQKEPGNPFYCHKLSFFEEILEGNVFTEEAAGKEYARASLLALKATLGVRGRPQSATGQCSIFTGVNAAKIIGRHLRGFPNERLRKILAEKGIFRQLRARSLKCTFANAYRPVFFRELKEGNFKNFSCSTLITYYAGLKFRDLTDLCEGQAVYMDITNNTLQEQGFAVPLISPQEAGARLIKISRKYDFILYEHFLTDIAGHSKDPEKAKAVITTLDAFLRSVAENMDEKKDVLFLTSDHGNLEDMSTKVHTFNPVPALVLGKRRQKFVSLLAQKGDITGILPAILEFLSAK